MKLEFDFTRKNGEEIAIEYFKTPELLKWSNEDADNELERKFIIGLLSDLDFKNMFLKIFEFNEYKELSTVGTNWRKIQVYRLE